MNTQAICRSCKKPKHRLNFVESKVVEGHKLALCNTCESKGYEPRSLLLMVLRTDPQGKEKTAPFIKNKLYCGDKITVDETL